MVPTAPPDDEVATLSSDLVTYAARLVRAVRRVNDLPAGVRPMSLLDEHGPLGISALAAIDRCSQPTMSAAVNQLVEKGLVTKGPNPQDARGTVVDLSDAGRHELARVRAINGRAVAVRFEALTATHRHTAADLTTAVAVLRDLLDTDPERGQL